MTGDRDFDVIIIGGSYAGLSAAMSLGRSLRNVLIIDSGLPCNRQTPYSHNFISYDGEKPSVIADKAKAQVLNYNTVRFHNDLAIALLMDPSSIVIPLLGFSLGIELGQLLVVFFIVGIAFLFLNVIGVKHREWNLFISGAAAGMSLISMLENKFW